MGRERERESFVNKLIRLEEIKGAERSFGWIKGVYRGWVEITTIDPARVCVEPVHRADQRFVSVSTI